MNWAKDIFNKYRSRTGVLVTHEFLEPGDGYDGDPDLVDTTKRNWRFSNEGIILNSKLVGEANNIKYVICGHQHGAYCITSNFYSRVVYNIVLDFQAAAIPHTKKEYNLQDYGHGLHFGMGLMTMMFIDHKQNRIHFHTYSPWAEKNGWFDQVSTFWNGSFSVPLQLVP